MLKSISVSKNVLNGCILKGTEMLIIMYSFVSIQVVRMSTIIVWFVDRFSIIRFSTLIAYLSSVARGGYSPPLAWKVCKIARFECFWGRFSLQKWKQPPNGIWEQKLWRTCCDLNQKIGVFFWSSPKVGWEKTFFFLQRSLSFGRKNCLNFGEDLFFFLEIT